jgi:hypothetical protein
METKRGPRLREGRARRGAMRAGNATRRVLLKIEKEAVPAQKRHQVNHAAGATCWSVAGVHDGRMGC